MIRMRVTLVGGFPKYPNCSELIDELLAHGADVNAPDGGKLGLTPLVLFNEPALAELLIARHADVNAPAQGVRNTGLSPLRFARQLREAKARDDSQLVAVLTRNGARE